MILNFELSNIFAYLRPRSKIGNTGPLLLVSTTTDQNALKYYNGNRIYTSFHKLVHFGTSYTNGSILAKIEINVKLKCGTYSYLIIGYLWVETDTFHISPLGLPKSWICLDCLVFSMVVQCKAEKIFCPAKIVFQNINHKSNEEYLMSNISKIVLNFQQRNMIGRGTT